MNNVNMPEVLETFKKDMETNAQIERMFRLPKGKLQPNDRVILQALEKQIVKPPEHKVHEKYKALGKNYYCSCGVMFVDFERNGTNYCGNCGQKLREVQE